MHEFSEKSNQNFGYEFMKNGNILSPKRGAGGGGGGGERPFGVSPKIHPCWRAKASLSDL